MYRRILVTGVSGILGATLRHTRDQYPGVEWTFSSRADCDLRDARACVAYVSRVRPDAILQLAAVSGGIGLSMRQPATMLRDNVLINLSVLEAARQVGIAKLVLALSSGMYPADAPQPIAETAIHQGPAHETNYGYAYAKRLLEPAIRAYREEFGLNVIGLVPMPSTAPSLASTRTRGRSSARSSVDSTRPRRQRPAGGVGRRDAVPRAHVSRRTPRAASCGGSLTTTMSGSSTWARPRSTPSATWLSPSPTSWAWTGAA